MNVDNRSNTLGLSSTERERQVVGRAVPLTNQGTGIRPRYEDNKRPHDNRGGNRNFSDRKPQTAKGHDAVLKDAQDNGKPVIVTLLGRVETIKGNVATRDRYTITIRVGNDFTIYYKHAIESIKVIQPTAAE